MAEEREIDGRGEEKSLMGEGPFFGKREHWLPFCLISSRRINRILLEEGASLKTLCWLKRLLITLKKPKEGDNVVIKLDMANAYDRVSWSFTCLVLRAMGFGEVFIDFVWRTMSNNWYSVIVNGTRHGFFHSTRGLKQGDPLSPALFILGAEVLSRILNLLHYDPNYKGFQMEIRGPQINHLCFADDVIIFTSRTRASLQLIMKTLGTYEAVSD
ncbi:hypothetical protein MTR67_001452 [Solanum verrucosum]|uniref:Reverse transcriptase domain-containing protein n=1 Tax=Solanum verrucosum TaxID=315347 RepID=A0AAF0PNN8_SOLVR|nr:hypothetical protein MTR67_001452 [Solanum verrucosum]